MKINQELIDRLVEYIRDELEDHMDEFIPTKAVESALKKGFRFQLELNHQDLYE